MLRTTLVTFFALLLVGDLVVRALPIDDSADTILNQLLSQNMMERRSRQQVKGGCVSNCVSCAKYAGMYADTCIRGCHQKAGKGAVNNAEFDAWSACQQFLYR